MHLIILLHLCQLGSQNNHFPTCALFFLSLFQNPITGLLSTLMLTLAFCIDQLTKRENFISSGETQEPYWPVAVTNKMGFSLPTKDQSQRFTHASKQALTELRPYQDWHLWMYLCLREIIFSCRLTKAWQWHQIRFFPVNSGCFPPVFPCVERIFTRTTAFLPSVFLLGLLHVSIELTMNSGLFVMFVCFFFFSSELKLTKVIGFLLC